MSNIFSDMLLPISDFIEGIPVIGKVIEWADKLADNTDPSQLGTAAIGKLIASTGKDGEWFEDTFTSEDARKEPAMELGWQHLHIYLEALELLELEVKQAQLL